MSRTPWRKSSHSPNNGSCVEMAASAQQVYVRDSKDATGPEIGLPKQQWSGFVNNIKNGGSQ